MIRIHTNLTIDDRLKRDFLAVHRGSLSRFVEEKMAEYLEMMELKWWLICHGCKQKVHIRSVLNREGICPKDGCGVVIAERIEDKKPASVQKVSPAPAAPPAVEKIEDKAESGPKVLKI